jgi:hypothetical protein
MKREPILDAVEEDVRAAAAEVDGATSHEITRALTEAVSQALSRHGLHVLPEYPVRCDGRRGRIDVAGISSEGLEVAVEIDITFKLRSLRKLEDAVRAGASSLWVRWGGDIDPWERLCVDPVVRYLAVPLAFQSVRELRRRERASAAGADSPQATVHAA